MARAIWLALAFASLASGARYVDYSGVKMPEYGGGVDYEGPRELAAAAVDDYREHSQDLSTGLDYKDEEETVKTEKSLQKDVEEEEWQKPVKKHKKSSLDDGNLDAPDKYSPEEVASKFKSNHRYSKHKPRLKLRNSEKDDIKHKHQGRYGRYRKEDLGDVYSKDDFQANDDFRDDKGVDFEDDKTNFNDRATTIRTPRRKPRDRFMKMDEDEDIEELLRRKPISDFTSDEESRQRVPSRRMPPRVGGAPRDSQSDVEAWRIQKTKPKKYEEYSDYYDMQRVQNMKDKLPVLLRRTSTPTTTTTSTEMFRTKKRLSPDEMIFRRYMAPVPVEELLPKNTESPPSKTTNTTTTTPSSISEPAVTPTRSSILTSLTTINPHEEIYHQAIRNASLQPSLAEKSRLSILKKAQRKEMVKGEGVTNKPPVLMQVTNKIQTLVMVEPATSEMPWQRAREVHDDTPDRLRQVKRLIRHKIVSNAKNIHDLTDNWDDMVCDYVDVSMLQDTATINFINTILILFSIFFVL